MRLLAIATTALRRIVDLGLVGMVVVVLFGVLLGKGAPLMGRQAIVIGGASMEPAIGLGSAIVIRPVDASTLAVGDVVSMQIGRERTTYTHRIVAVVDRADGRWIRTKGDANAEPDPTLVPATAVIGRVEIVVPGAGYLLALLSLRMGVLFVLGLAATLLAIAWLLESLELEAPASRKPAHDRSPESAGRPAIAPELLAGEPIAALPAPSTGNPGSGSGGRTAPGWRIGATVAGASPSSSSREVLSGPDFAARARPTVREQLARSREARHRRARWPVGRGERRPAAD